MPRDATGTAITDTPFWWDDAPLAELPSGSLPGKTDIVIVGAGYTGLSAALTLARAGRSVLVLDAASPGEGASTRNGGMCGDWLKPGLGKLTHRYGRERALALLHEAGEAFDWHATFIAEEAIQCRYARTGHFAGALKPAQYEAMARELEELRRTVGLDAEMVPRNEVRNEIGTDLYVGGRVMNRRSGLHPALYHRGLLDRARSAGASVAGHTPVTGLSHDGAAFRVETPQGPVAAAHVIVATNGYTGPVTPWLRRRVIPVTSYMIATEELPAEKMARLMPKGRMLTDTNRLLCYFRPSPDRRRILFGGRPAYTDIGPQEGARRLHRHLAAIFPELKDVRLTHSWRGYIAYTFDRLPHVGEHDGIHYAMGYCGSGVVMSSWLGRKTALRLLGSPEGRSAFAEIGHPDLRSTKAVPGSCRWFRPGTKELTCWDADRRLCLPLHRAHWQAAQEIPLR